MKLVIAIIHERDKHKVSDALLQAGHKFTNIATTGGFLRDGNCTLLIGAEDDKVDEIISILDKCCHTREQFVSQTPIDTLASGGMVVSPVKVMVGGAIIFVVNVERYERV
ncbi:MAG: cyclic-di-AMP receptor [Armatimonadota bacterium]|nr:cyclic-di-AMP receptor [Armatimonadota bacterium]